jgi:hypothetical protein
VTADLDEVTRAARLLQFGLSPRARPGQEPAYRELLDRYFDHAGLRALVAAMARGLELQIVDASIHGLVLAPGPESVFSPSSDDLRHASADDRLLEGLIQVAVAASLFPRPEDLAEEASLARPPLTIDEVEENLRALASRLEEQARQAPDPTADEETAGLSEAWRVYQQRAAAKENRLGGKGARSTRRLIEVALERLVEHGCFTRQEGGAAFYPTWRYQVLVRELAAMRLFEQVQAVLGSG